MPYYGFVWTTEIIDHLGEHGVSQEDFEHVVSSPEVISVSRSTGRPCCWGEASDGRCIFCVFEKINDITIVPITAYEIPRRNEFRDKPR